jgi:hypothetical protein
MDHTKSSTVTASTTRLSRLRSARITHSTTARLIELEFDISALVELIEAQSDILALVRTLAAPLLRRTPTTKHSTK